MSVRNIAATVCAVNGHNIQSLEVWNYDPMKKEAAHTANILACTRCGWDREKCLNPPKTKVGHKKKPPVVESVT